MAVSSARSMVRSQGRAARQAIVETDRTHRERQLISHLHSLDALHARSVGVFVAHDGEPDLAPLISWMWERRTVVALPVLEDDDCDFSMRFVPWSKDEQLSVGRYNIPVPVAGDEIVPETLLVSFAGFDAAGNRIGRGGGFFDRYLAGYGGTVVGVGFEAQRFDAVPVEPHDHPLATIATDLGVRFVQ